MSDLPLKSRNGRPKMRRVIPLLILALILAFHSRLRAAEPMTTVGIAVDAELEIERIITKANPEELKAYFKNRGKPGSHRGRAVRAYFGSRKPPLKNDDRALLQDLLSDADVPVRLAAVQIVGDLKEQALSRRILELASGDQDQSVRVAALISARQWTRLTHLFYLEAALNSKSDAVRAEAVRSIAILSPREVQPAMIARIQGLLAPENATNVRRAALDAMRTWGMVDWEMLRQIIADHGAAESLRIYAIEVSDSIPEAVAERAYTLLEIVNRETSINLGWWAFSRLRIVSRTDKSFHQGLGRLLASTTQLNTATSEMAVFLRSVGLRAEYKGGGWKVGPK